MPFVRSEMFGKCSCFCRNSVSARLGCPYKPGSILILPLSPSPIPPHKNVACSFSLLTPYPLKHSFDYRVKESNGKINKENNRSKSYSGSVNRNGF